MAATCSSKLGHHRVTRDLTDDILIDLNGLTARSRLAVMRWRPAPIQATYLGFIGPVPLPELDYLLSDNFVIPPEYEAAYRPSPMPTARIYQANDSKRKIGSPLARHDLGLPDDGFVLCCFPIITKSPKPCSTPGCRFFAKPTRRCLAVRR